jgi:phosphopantothenoylcysteine decarboxylase/phosphopantothenate--cysteine ligase
VGFAAETGPAEAAAREKLAAKGCDWIVANDVTTGVFGADENAVVLVERAGAEAWPRAPKSEIARKLVRKIAETLK